MNKFDFILKLLSVAKAYFFEKWPILYILVANTPTDFPNYSTAPHWWRLGTTPYFVQESGCKIASGMLFVFLFLHGYINIFAFQ